ncbi:alpha/beta hydrolase [Sphingomonas sp.]|uniref:alpha/beta fold hydrolase n=1 Tax=Sphingomonas sp. TaxID=28214 RepID=UPI0031DC4CBC
MIHRRGLFALFAMLLTAALLPAPAAAKDFASTRITVAVEGQGKDVILIPGLSSSPRVWKEMIAAVPGYRYHLVQVHGFAGTPAGGNAEGDVAASVAEDVARYIAEQKLGSVAVIGHSMGGTMGMMLAARHPASVSRLLVVDMLPFMGALFGNADATPTTLKPIADYLYNQSRAATPEARDKQLTGIITAMVNSETMRAGALEDARKSDPEVTARAYRDLILTDLRPELPRITARTTILYITPKGVTVNDAQVDALYQSAFAGLKGAVLKRVPNSAHFIMWDNAPFFQSEVKAFLTD